MFYHTTNNKTAKMMVAPYLVYKALDEIRYKTIATMPESVVSSRVNCYLTVLYRPY